MAYHVEIEPICFVIRIGQSSKFYGPKANTKYEFVCTLLKFEDSAFLMAAHGEFTREMYKRLKKELDILGIKNVQWTKLNTQKKRKIKKEI
jgi:hypothetical protein